MTTRTLKIVVNQSGNAQAGLKGIATSFDGIKKAGAVAAGGLAVIGGATLAAGSYLVGLGSDAEEMQGKFDVVFSQTGGQVTQALDEFGNAVGRNRFELMGYAATLGDTLKPLGMTEEAAADFAVQLTQLGVDLSSFNNMPMDEAMRRLQGTLIGSHENALAFGVVINENTLKAELAKNGWDSLTGAQLEQAKVQARINLLMQGTTDAQGDAERTAGSWANQTRALKANLEEAATTMGTQLLPVVTPLLQNFTAWITDIMPKAVEIFTTWASELRATVGPAIVIIKDAVLRMAEAFGVNTEGVSAGDVVLKALKGTLDLVVITIKTVAVVMDIASRAVQTFSRWNQNLIDSTQGLRNVTQGAMDAIKRGIDRVVSAWDTLKRKAREAVDAIPSWLRPGSPSEFEIALYGVAKALKTVGTTFGETFGGDTPNPMGGIALMEGMRGPGIAPIEERRLPRRLEGWDTNPQVNVTVNYSPLVSTVAPREAQDILMPIIQDALRQVGVAPRE